MPIAWAERCVIPSHEHRRGVSGRFDGNGSLNSDLRAMGLLGNKRVPQEYLTAAIPQRLALLQGLMDSDGYVDEFGRCEFVNMREDISWAVHELAASLGLRPTRRKKRAMLNGIDHGPAYQVTFTPRRLPVFRLARKLARLKTDDRGHEHRSVRAVRPVPTVPVRCIQVSAPERHVPHRRFLRAHAQLLAGPPRPAHALDRGVRRPRVLRPHHAGAVQRGQPADHALAGHEDRPALHVPADQPVGAPVRLGGLRLPLPGPARADAVPVLPQLHPRGDPPSGS